MTLLHGVAFAFSDGWTFAQFWGTALTFVLLGAAGGMGVWRAMPSL